MGPLQAPGAHDAAAERAMRADADAVFAVLNGLRDAGRAALLRQGAVTAGAGGGGLVLERAPVDVPGPAAAPAAMGSGGNSRMAAAPTPAGAVAQSPAQPGQGTPLGV